MSSEQPEWAPILNPRDLGSFVQRVRQRRGISQEDLAEDLGISRPYLSQIEAGKPGLYTERLFAVLRDLGIVLKAEAR